MPPQQIGWSQESILLNNILSKINRLIAVASAGGGSFTCTDLDACTNVVHTTTNESIAGEKDFTDYIKQFGLLVKPYKVYRALITQSGTDAPTTKVLENNLGGDIVFSRISAGLYAGTLTGAFTLDKTFIPYSTGDGNLTTTIIRASADVINIVTSVPDLNLGTPTDGILTDFPLEILVYY